MLGIADIFITLHQLLIHISAYLGFLCLLIFVHISNNSVDTIIFCLLIRTLSSNNKVLWTDFSSH